MTLTRTLKFPCHGFHTYANYYHNTFPGHGFHSAPVIGQVLGEMALNKDTSFNIEKFSMKRFEKNDTHLQSKL